MKAYSFANHIGILNNTQVSGYAEGDSVFTLEFTSKPTVTYGADGTMNVSFPAGRGGKVTVSLAATSDYNKVFSDLWALQQAGPAYFVPCQFGAKDTYRNDVFAGVNGVITEPAKPGRGEKADKQVWEMTFEKVIMALGAPQFVGFPSQFAEAAGVGR